MTRREIIRIKKMCIRAYRRYKAHHKGEFLAQEDIWLTAFYAGRKSKPKERIK